MDSIRESANLMPTDDQRRFQTALDAAKLSLDERDIAAALPVFLYLENACALLKTNEKASRDPR